MSAPHIVIFGAGATGRGQIAQLASEAGYHITFVEANADLVGLLRASGRYVVRLVGTETREVAVTGFDICYVADTSRVADAIASADLVATAVLPANLPRVAPLVAEGIRARMAAGITKPLNVLACENMAHGSTQLSCAVAEQLTSEERAYAREHIGFPDAMVARVVPVPEDPLVVVAEVHNEWAADARAFAGPAPELPGLTLVDNHDHVLRKKLYIHNCGHATCAYYGFLSGYTYIHEAAGDPTIFEAIRATICESGRAVSAQYGFGLPEIKAYEQNLLDRIVSDAIPDDLARVMREPIRKLGPDERFIGPLLLCERHRLPSDHLCRAVAAVLVAVEQSARPGRASCTASQACTSESRADPETRALADLLSSGGAAAVLRDICGLDPSGDTGKRILRHLQDPSAPARA